MEDLFSPDPQFRQGQYQRLSDNTNEWEQQIYAALEDLIPRRLGAKPNIHWQKVDDQQGYAIGTALLSDGGKTSVGIPIIIKQWHLAPLDVMLIGGDKAYPLSQESLKDVFEASELATETISRNAPTALFDSGSQYESTYPPVGGGRYVYSSAQLLEQALAEARQEQIEQFKQACLEDPQAVAGFESRGLFDRLKKIASSKGKMPKKSKRKSGTIQVEKKGINQYRILGTPEGLYDPAVGNVDRKTTRGFVRTVSGADAADAVMDNIDRYQSYQIANPALDQSVGNAAEADLGPRGRVTLYPLDKEEKAQPVGKYGVYGVRDRAGVMSYGPVFTNVIDFDKKKKDLQVFVGKTLSAVQRKIAAVPCPQRDNVLDGQEMVPGSYGVLAMVKDGNALCTVPFEVLTVSNYGPTRWIKIKDLYGHPLTLHASELAEGITRMASAKAIDPTISGPVYSYPAKMLFVPLPAVQTVASSDDEHKKTAALHLDSQPLKIIRSNDRYVFRAPQLGKYANVNGFKLDFEALNRPEAEFFLGAMGCPCEKIAQALNAAGTLPEPIEVHHLSWAKLASEIEDPSLLLEKAARSLQRLLIKEASVMEDAEIVDVALSLGFINPDNINKFIQSIPRLKECLSTLSKILIASRLGMSNIPEQATQSTIQNMLKVIDGLKRIGLAGEGKSN